MTMSAQLWLLLTLSGVAATYYTYKPRLTTNSVQGRLTATTFILEKPQCLFDVTTSNNVWLIVANKTVQLNSNSLTNSAPRPKFQTSGYYWTLPTPENKYTCNNVADFIRVGDETSCSDKDICNAPLPSPGPYRVMFVVLNGNSLVYNSEWSDLITLRQGKAASLIDTWPGGRSGGMIVLTSILSVLLATFLVCLIGTFIVGRRIKKNPDSVPVPPVQATKNYATHHAPENPNIYSVPKL
ncbi:uroplakin-3b [Leptodactylus fuscus]|uniref:uroplakin-3b-like n=1 Tax=Leptodactylus fuscus TaxID=238119 RepID=UPI003F4E5B32